MTEIRINRGMADRYERVLREAGATGQELARFAHLQRRAPAGAFYAIMAMECGMPAAEAIDGCAEIARDRARGADD